MEYFGYNKQKKKDAGLSKEDYYAQEANQIVRRVDPRPRFHPIIANHPFDSVQADVLDMSYYVGQNHKRRYLLTFIDVYSRYVWFYVMNKKSELTDGIKSIFKEMGSTPENITTDNEFVNNNEIQKMFKDKSINHFVEDIDDHRKLGIINRFHRTIRTVIHKFMVKNDTKKWYKAIGNLVDAYNNSFHSSIKAVPAEILEHPEKRLPNETLFKQPAFNIPIGSYVRVRRTFKIMDKRSSSDLWSRNIYQVVGRDKNAYILDNDKKKLAADLQVVTPPAEKSKEKEAEPAPETNKEKENRDEKEEAFRKEKIRQNRLAKLQRELAY